LCYTIIIRENFQSTKFLDKQFVSTTQTAPFIGARKERKNIMKKTLVSIILCTMVLALPGCGSSSPGVVTVTNLSTGESYTNSFLSDENFMKASVVNRILIQAPEGTKIRIELDCSTCESPVVAEYTCSSKKMLDFIRCKGGILHIPENFYFELEAGEYFSCTKKFTD
jgi:hypothetical protein